MILKAGDSKSWKYSNDLMNELFRKNYVPGKSLQQSLWRLSDGNLLWFFKEAKKKNGIYRKDEKGEYIPCSKDPGIANVLLDDGRVIISTKNPEDVKTEAIPTYAFMFDYETKEYRFVGLFELNRSKSDKYHWYQDRTKDTFDTSRVSVTGKFR